MSNKTTLYLCNNSYGLGAILKNNSYVVDEFEFEEFIVDVFKKKDIEPIKYKWISKDEFDQREQEIALKATRS